MLSPSKSMLSLSKSMLSPSKSVQWSTVNGQCSKSAFICEICLKKTINYQLSIINYHLIAPKRNLIARNSKLIAPKPNSSAQLNNVFAQ